MESVSYKSAGVDLEVYAEAMARLPKFAKQTHTPRVMDLAGGFAGLFRLNGDGKSYEDPVLVSGTDGVGTKIKVAIQANQYKTIGIDLVAMCVNDCLCIGAEPLFFLDYLALPKDNPDLISDLVEGVSEGCKQAEAALIGGETAIMPDLYAEGEFDMAGFCVGVVERSQIVDGSKIQPGDQLIGIPSSGLHSNGYSLVRKVVFELAQLSIADEIPELNATVGDTLLEPTRLYTRIVRSARNAVDDGQVTGIAHITGGGLEENVSRILPDDCELMLDKASWEVPKVFSWLQQLGSIHEEEMQRVFNMGIGMVFVVRAEASSDLMTGLRAIGEEPVVLGHVQAS